MKIIHLVPRSQGYLIDGALDTQSVPAIVEDGGDWFAMILDSVRGTYHIERFKDKNAVFKFSIHNFERIEDDEQWEALDKFLHDKGAGIIVDGMRHKHTGSLEI